MSLPLTKYGATRRSIFYDELSHLNPIYASPAHDDLWPFEAERRYHLRNLRLLSLYFESIIFMTGNVLNLPNHTTRTIVFSVLADRSFVEMCETGIVVFCGWGARVSGDMAQNQVEYARIYRPDLKDAAIINHFRSLTGLSTTLIREEAIGEEDFINVFLERMHVRAERSAHKDWKRVDAFAQLVQSNVGYLGTMEFFPHLDRIDPAVKRAAHEVYLDAWIDYAAKRYHPVCTYESPRYRLNMYRTVHPRPGQQAIASVLLSPQFFQSVLLRFLSEEEVYRVLNLAPRRLARLRNGEWAIFCGRYHTYLEACSEVLWRLQILSKDGSITAPEALFEQVIADTMRDRSQLLDAAHFAEFLSHAIGFFAGIPGLSAIISSVFRPFNAYLSRRAKKAMQHVRMGEFYPFINKMRAAVT